MRLLIDECVSDPTRIFLKEAGHELITVESLARSGAANGEILGLARRHRSVLGDLRIFPLGTHHGIVVLKIQRAEDVDPVHRHLREALQDIPTSQLRGSLLIVDRNKYRLRRSP